MKTSSAVFFIVALASMPRVAAAATCESFGIENVDRQSDDATFARTLYNTALRARSAECLVQADRLLEGAHRAYPDALYVYERILVREEMTDTAYARELLDAYRDELSAHPEIGDLVEIDFRLRAKLHEPSADQRPPRAPARSALNTVGPVALGIVGLVGLGLAAYGLTARCDLHGGDGTTCLRGSRTAVGPTAAYGVLGLTALAGATFWWFAAPPRGHGAALGVALGLRF